jgi:protein-tyrosine-phosphatase
MKKKILFICTGNTCRSPMAVALFEKYLRENFPDFADVFEVDSAGLYALEGASASQEAIQVLQDEEDIDLTLHRSKTMQSVLGGEAYLILTMTGKHKEHLLDMYPALAGKIYTLNEFAGSDIAAGIVDPFGLGLEAYQKSYAEIKSLILDVLGQVCKESDAEDKQ